MLARDLTLTTSTRICSRRLRHHPHARPTSTPGDDRMLRIAVPNKGSLSEPAVDDAA